MIHNPHVNDNLLSKGIKFIQDTSGNQLIDWNELKADDIVILPAFGTTLEIEEKLKNIGIQIEKYDTTCPFVKKVWNSSKKLGDSDYSIIIHGKFKHEETRATFSHSGDNAPSVVILNMEEAEFIGDVILGKRPENDFYEKFEGKYTEGFVLKKDFERIGVVNQTTMLASETHAISMYFRKIMVDKFGEENIKNHFADTRDTLCYATNDNQDATLGLLNIDADLALVVGGYNSSNTSHLVELLEDKFKTFYISSANEFDEKSIKHYNYKTKEIESDTEFLPQKEQVKIILTSGASCPDAMVDEVLDKILAYYQPSKSKEEVLMEIEKL
jgi:4-hydroxy-3-methylbut-2-enyl diphosphate reductase